MFAAGFAIGVLVRDRAQYVGRWHPPLWMSTNRAVFKIARSIVEP